MIRAFRFFLVSICAVQVFQGTSHPGSYDAYSVLNKKPVIVKKAFQLSSPAFNPHNLMPAKYTCDGSNISPPLVWTEPPLRTKSLALICEDADSGYKIWSHWVLYRISADQRKLKENTPRLTTLDDGSKQGINDFSKTGYSGPCPPSGTHRYVFKLYALDRSMTPSSMMTKDQLQHLMRGHILEQAELVGIYQRQK